MSALIKIGADALTKPEETHLTLSNPLVRDAATSVGGGVAGYYVGRGYGHPVLGVLGGLTVGGNVQKIFRREERTTALCNLGTEAAAIGLALVCKSNIKGLRGAALGAAGYGVGAIIGRAVTDKLAGKSPLARWSEASKIFFGSAEAPTP